MPDDSQIQILFSKPMVFYHLISNMNITFFHLLLFEAMMESQDGEGGIGYISESSGGSHVIGIRLSPRSLRSPSAVWYYQRHPELAA